MWVITRKRFEHCIAYTKGNRLSWEERHTHPEMFCYYERVENALLPEGYAWQGYGNLRLLDELVKVAVLLHHHEVVGSEAYLQLRAWAVNVARSLGGWIHFSCGATPLKRSKGGRGEFEGNCDGCASIKGF